MIISITLKNNLSPEVINSNGLIAQMIVCGMIEDWFNHNQEGVIVINARKDSEETMAITECYEEFLEKISLLALQGITKQ